MSAILKKPKKHGAIIISLLFLIAVMQCEFRLPGKFQAPSWNLTLTMPLLNQRYGFDGLVDTANMIYVYADSADTNSDGIYDVPVDSAAGTYPGGIYLAVEGLLDSLTVPDNIFRVPRQSPLTVGVGPVALGSQLPESIRVAVDSTVYMLDMIDLGFQDQIIQIPKQTCANPDSILQDTIRFRFGNNPGDLNANQDVLIPGYTRIDTATFYLPIDTQDFIEQCSDTFAVYQQDTSFTITDTIDVPRTELPHVRQAVGILPDPALMSSDSPIESFQSVTIGSGSIRSILSNQMPITINDYQLLVYTKKANGDTVTLHNQFYSQITPYFLPGEGYDSLVTDLTGKTLYDSLIVEFQGYIPATSGQVLNFLQSINPYIHYGFSVSINAFQTADVVFRDISQPTVLPFNTTTTAVDPATGDSSTFSVSLVSAEIKDSIASPDTNRIILSFTNKLATDIQLNLHLKNFYANADTTGYIIHSINIPQNTSTIDTMVLNGYILRSANGVDPIDSLQVETEVIMGSGGVTTLDLTQDSLSLSGEVAVRSIQFQDLSGYFDLGFTLSNQSIPISMPGFTGISFADIILTLDIYNELQVEPGLGLIVTGINGSDTAHVRLDKDSVTVSPGYVGSPTLTTLRVNRSAVSKTTDGASTEVQHFTGGDAITDLFRIVPTEVTVGGAAKIDRNGLSTISQGAKLWGTWRVEVPFYFEVDSNGVEFLPGQFSKVAPIDLATRDKLVGADSIPDQSDMLQSSRMITTITNQSGLNGELQLIVSDLKYFPFYNSIQNKVLVSADLNDDGNIDTLDLNLDTLIIHPNVPLFKVQLAGGTVDSTNGIVISGGAGQVTFANSADFNVLDTNPDSTYGSFIHHQYAYLDTFRLARAESDQPFVSVDDALQRRNITTPTVNDSLYNLEISSDGMELFLMYDVTPFGELGWLLQDRDHYIATKFRLDKMPYPALLTGTAGIQVSTYIEFVLKSGPLLGN